jgi:hypothetical protein
VRFINLLILFGIGRNCLRSGGSLSEYLSIRRGIKQTVVMIEDGLGMWRVWEGERCAQGVGGEA